MAVDVVVCVKQVLDPEMPPSAFRIDTDNKRFVSPQGIPPVVNGFDENAIEAALRIKESTGGKVTVVSVGNNFQMDVMKKPLSMGADELILIQGDEFESMDSIATAHVLAAALKKVESYQMVLCGRQASDWDNAQVPLVLAELLGLPSVTIAQKIDVGDNELVTIQRAIQDGYEVIQAELPILVTVSNELGEPRYPTLRGIMAATRKTPLILGISDLDVEESDLSIKLQIEELFVPEKVSQCEMISGDDDSDAGRKLALKLREEKII